MMKKELVTVQSQRPLTSNVYELVCSGSLVNEMTTPGQFLHLRVSNSDDLLLRRPISICDVDLDAETVKMLYRVEGSGTKRLSEKKQVIRLIF
ncbi:dihydroorotate dehydrogenase electron transfer subunit [Halalkalibacter hemicellulosilyticusJCM 9152]|uniref:Dihydroorotate dehydrogenase electron transfer subunit n=1 Tax=Halalkalibacter hemicellulosilyticusJCM 9152 TaxID=1236971 RepID=W4QAY8_9BACI|nr:dihydroorotate dehydrogenase electron transfer subunit [Halalkalibacter hemicellulosilyticusJCM 9152]